MIMKSILAILFIATIAITLYLLTLRGSWGNPEQFEIKNHLEYSGSPFESSHERSPYALLLSLKQNRTPELSMDLADLGAPDVGYYKGHFYSFFPPGLVFLALPFYDFGYQFNASQLASYFVVPIFSVISLIFLFLISRQIFKLPITISLLVCLIFGFASTAWGYSVTFYQHAISTALIISAFYAVWKFKTGEKLTYLWAGLVWFNYGFAIMLDYPNALLMLPVMFYFLLCAFKFKRTDEKLKISFKTTFLLTSIFFIGITYFHASYNMKYYGDWKKFSNTFARYEQGKFDALLKNLVTDEGQLKLDRQALNLNAIYKEDQLLSGLNTLTIADDKGIFFFSPIFILGVIYIFTNFKKFKQEEYVLISLILINVISYASFNDPWGGWAFGPRYLIPTMAYLSIFVGLWLGLPKMKILRRGVFLVLFSISCAISLVGALTTNIVPPKIEALPLHIQYYNYLLNFNNLFQGQSGSFIYNTYLSKSLNLTDYYLLIFGFIVTIVLCLLFFIPEEHEH